MALNKKYAILFLVLIFTLLFGVTMASAATVDDNNHTTSTIEKNKLFTPNNHDVDKKVQSDTKKISTEKVVETKNTQNDSTKEKLETATTKTINKQSNTRSVKQADETVTVSSMDDINAAIQHHSAGDTVTLLFQNDIVRTTGFNNFQGMTLIFNGNGYKLDGNAQGELMQPAYQSQVIFRNLTFTNIGVGLQINNPVNVTLDNCVVTNVTNGFIKVNAMDTNLTFKNSLIYNNTASSGTIVFVQQPSSIVVDNCTIENNTAQGGGGVFYVTSATNIHLKDSYLKNNTAMGSDGGGILFTNTNAELLFEHNTFDNNHGPKGAVITANNAGTKGSLVNNTFINHNITADQQGQYPNAVIYVMDGQLELIGNTIKNNHAGDSANIVTFAGATNMTNNTIENNTAESGSIFHLFKEGTVANISNNYVSDNIILEKGDYFIFKFYEYSSGPGQYSLPVQKAIITNNLFVNNTYVPEDSTDGRFIDILMSDYGGDREIANNSYVHNALNVTNFEIDHINQDEDKYIIYTTVDLRGIYNDTVHNGTMHLLDKDGNTIGSYTVVNGTCNITIAASDIPEGNTINDLKVQYESYFKHYQFYGTPKPSRITINPDPQSVAVGGTVKLSGYLTDNNQTGATYNQPIAGANIAVSVGGVTYTTTTNDEGYYEVDYPTTTSGVQSASAFFYVDLGYETSHAETSFTVTEHDNKIATNITIQAPTTGVVNSPITINVTLTNVTENPVSLDGETVYVNVTSTNIDTHEQVITQYSGTITDGKFQFEYTPVNAVGINITAKFDGDDTYRESNDEAKVPNFDLERVQLTVVADPVRAYVGEAVRITATLLDSRNNPISGQQISISLDGVEHQGLAPTNNQGVVTYLEINKPYKPESYKIAAHYEGKSAVYAGADAQTEFYIDKHPTSLVITPIESGSVVLNTPFEVTVTLTNNTSNTNPIQGKKLVVRVNHDEVIDLGENVTDENGVLKFNYTATRDIPYTFEVSFEGDDYYNASSAKYTYDDPIELLTSIVTVEIDRHTIIVNESVTINGTLTDSQGNKLAGRQVVIKINNHVIDKETTDSDGKYTLTLTKDNEKYAEYLQYNSRPYKVTVSYPGESGVITGDAATENYVVTKMPTNITITPIPEGSIVINIPFEVTVTLKNNTVSVDPQNGNTNPIVGKEVSVKVNGIPVVFEAGQNVTDANGQIKFNYNVTSSNIYTFEATFAEDEEYMGDTDTYVYDDEIALLESDITVNVRKTPVYINNSIEIYGNLVDSQGNNIKNATVIIKVDNHEIGTNTTDENGNFNFTMTNDTPEYQQYLLCSDDPYWVTAIYTGKSSAITGDAASTAYNIIKIPTTVRINVADKVDNGTQVEITADVTADESSYNPINYDNNFTFIIDGSETTVKIENGIARIMYQATELKTVNVTGKFGENAEFEYAQDSKTFEIVDVRTPTNATIEVEGLRYAKEKFDVTITLKDDNNQIIPNQDVIVNITVTGEDGVNSTPYTTDANGQIKFKYTPANIHNITITVSYPGNTTFRPCENETTVKTGLMPSSLTVDVTPNPSTVNQSIVISGNLHDLVENITGANIAIIINGETVNTAVTDSEGNYAYTVTSTQWDKYLAYDENSYVVQVYYGYVLDVTNGADNLTTYKVVKIPTQLAIEDITDAKVNQTIQIQVTLTNTTQPAEPINDKALVIKVNGKTIDTSTLRTENGIITVDYTPKDNSTLSITAEFVEDELYAGSSTDKEITIGLTTPVLSCNLNESYPYVGDSVNITGTLLNGQTPIANAIIKVYLDNQQVATVVTDANGEYSCVVEDFEKGTYTVKTEFDGIENVLNKTSSEEKTIVVNKLNTITLVDVHNTTAGNVSIDVEVKDFRGSNVTTGELEITTPEKTFKVNVTGDITNIALNLTSGENIPVTVKYIENPVYLESNGLNKTSYELDPEHAEEFTKITVNKQNTNLTVNIPEAKYGEKVNITGKLTDEKGNPLSEKPVVVTVDGNQYPTTTDRDGNYNVEVPVEKVGEIPVKVEFAGDDVYNSSKAEGTMDAGKGAAVINAVMPINATVNKPANITGNVTDKDGKPLAGVNVTVTVNGEDYKTVTGENGNFTVEADNVVVGLNDVTVVASNDEFEADSVEDKFLGNKQNSNLTVDPVSEVSVGSNATIKGKLTDDEGKPIANAPVDVFVGDRFKTVITDNRGNYEAIMPVDEMGETNVTVKYAGDDTYNPSDNKTKVNVGPISAVINVVMPTNATVNKPVDITGNVTDENGKPLANVPVNVTVNGKIYPAVTDSEGKFNVTADNVVVGDNPVTVKVVDDGYDAAPVSDSFTADKQNTNLTVVIPEAKYNENVNITGKLTDDEGKALADKDILVTVDSKQYPTTTDKDGNYKVEVPVERVGEIPVKVEFNGDDVYNSSKAEGTMDAGKGTATIDVLIPENATVNKPANITGNVTDKYGKPIPGINVTVVINDKPYNVTTDGNGNFTVEADNIIPGINNVTVFVDDDKFEADPVEDKLPGNKQNSNLTIDPISEVPIGSNATITGKLTDDEGKPIANAPVDVIVGDRIKTVTTDNNGNYKAELPVDKLGETPVVVKYAGDDTYNPAEDKDTMKVVPKKANINVTMPTNATVNKPANITGKVTGEDGKPLSNVPVNVTVNDKIYPVVTDEKGTFTVPVDNIVPGNNPVTVKVVDDKVDAVPVSDSFTADKQKTNLTVDTPKATYGEKTNITGKLTDDEGKPLSNAPITITLPNGTKIPTTTKPDGTFEVAADLPVGNNQIKVDYPGNATYKPISQTKTVNVEKAPTTTTINAINNIAGNVTVSGTVKDNLGRNVPEGRVTIKSGNNTIGTGTVTNGNYNIKTNIGSKGTYTIVAQYSGTDKYQPSNSQTLTTPVIAQTPDLTTKVEGNKVGNTTVTATLKDPQGKPISNAPITVTLPNGTKVTGTTNSNGVANIPVDLRAGENILNISYAGNGTYNPVSNKETAMINKNPVKIILAPVKGIIGEKITLTANITDENGNPISGGNLAFKLNGKTLRADGRFDSKAPAMKFSVKDGKVTYTINADLYLRNAKNLTAAYSGTYKFEEIGSPTVEAQIQKRYANVTVTVTPTKTKQYETLTFTATVRDTTKNGKNTTLINQNTSVMFKVNGNTLKDKNGKTVYVPVDANKQAIYNYTIPAGTGGITSSKQVRDYKVEAVFVGNNYYPGARNSSKFNVERSPITININEAKVNTNNVLNVKATIKDYKGNNVLGTNKYTIKVNGKSYTDKNGKPVYWSAKNGVVDLTGIQIDPKTTIKRVMIVTGERQAYLEGRNETTNIIRA